MGVFAARTVLGHLCPLRNYLLELFPDCLHELLVVGLFYRSDALNAFLDSLSKLYARPHVGAHLLAYLKPAFFFDQLKYPTKRVRLLAILPFGGCSRLYYISCFGLCLRILDETHTFQILEL